MNKVKLPIPSERLIGFTIPQSGRFLICDHDSVWQVDIGGAATAQEIDENPYSIAEGADFLGLGQKNAAVLTAGTAAISHNLDPYADVVIVQYTFNEERGEIEFPTFSGDWFYASLSREGDLLVLAEPYKIDIYRT